MDRESHDDNGKNGMAAVLFNLLDELQATGYFARMSLASHGAERDCGHTGNFWNMTWAMPGVAQAGPQASGAWMDEFGAWSFDLARGWDGAVRHQGPPEVKDDSTGNWDATGAYLLAYAMPLKNIWLTGRRGSKITPLTAEVAKQTVLDGRGWSQGDKFSAYDKLGVEMLFERLSSWSPVVRERAAIAIARRKDAPVEALVKLLVSGDLQTRLGACQALAQLKGKAEEGIQACVDYARSQNPWASEKRTAELMKILCSYGARAKPVVPELKRIADDFAKGEPDFPKALSLQKAASIREAGSKIEASTENPALIRIQ